MKIIAFFIMATLVHVQAATYGQKVSLDFKDASLSEVLEEIQKQTGYDFLYNSSLIDQKKGITVKTKEGDLKQVLTNILSSRDLSFEVDRNSVLIKRNTSPTHLIEVRRQPSEKEEKQQRVISGTVRDVLGEPISGVTVTAKESNVKASTNEEGQYSISIDDSHKVLVFSSVGYISQEITLGNLSAINVVLQEQVGELDEVVIVGYGTQKKGNLTGSVESVSGEDILRRTTSSGSVALQGMVPGLSAVQSSGQPGADVAAIKIRGTGSLNSATSPLVLIDGVEGDMNRIDLNSVESISVLKDAASASIYGSRASNGVILITTKRGREGKMKITYNGYVGTNNPTDLPESVSAVEFMEAINVASENADQDPKYTQELIDLYRNGGADNLLNYDTQWKDEVLKKSAFQQNHSVSLNGGNEISRFFASAGYVSQNGLIQANSFSRTNVRLNTDTKIREWLKAGVDVNIRQSNARRPVMETPNNIIGYALTLNPLLSGRNADGTYGYGVNGINPIALAEVGGVRNDIAPELGVRTFVEINPFAGFDITAGYSYRKLDSEMDAFVYPYEVFEGGTSRGTYPSTGSSRAEERGKMVTKQYNFLASYEKTLARNYFKAMVGLQSEELSYKMISARRQNFIIKEYNEIFNGDPSTMSNGGDRYDSALLSYLFRVNYSFADRYLLEVNGRFDGSSRFINDNRWGFFPSVSAGWKVSEEDFFTPIKAVVNSLKIRGSYGLLGNQSISGYYPYTSSIAAGSNYWFDKGLVSGASQSQLANESISWEKSEQLNLGVDIGLVNQKLTFTFDYYTRDITDMLQRFDLPYFVGMGAPWENAGSMRNKGWELSANWRSQINNFKYYVTGNISDVKNKIINLYGNEYLGASTITREGDPYNSYYGYVSDGIFQSQAEIDAVSSVYGGKKENVKPGFIRYKDVNGDDVIDTKDRMIIGNPAPRYEYSFTLGGEWKGLDFSAFFQGVGKRDVFYSGPGARPLFGATTTLYTHQLDYWTEDNKNAAYPLLLNDVAGTGSNNIVSDFWIRSGAYLRLKNLVVGYTVPKAWTDRATIDNLRFYVSGQNLFTKSNTFKGYDPENSISNGNYYPLMKSFNFGLSIDF